MNLHYPTVPIEVARQKAAVSETEKVPPVILVVDDEPLIAETLAAILKGVGMAAITAPDAQAALEIARVIPPQMLITDVAMPSVNGLELAVEVKAIAPDCEIILLSGQPSTYDLMTEYNARGYQFETLIKPVHPSDLLMHVFERLDAHDATIPGRIAPMVANNGEDCLTGAAPVAGNPRARRVRKPRVDLAEPNGLGPLKFQIN
jgi:DNA-binding response OmpR family regulator